MGVGAVSGLVVGAIVYARAKHPLAKAIVPVVAATTASVGFVGLAWATKEALHELTD